MAAANPLNSGIKIISGSANPELSKEISNLLKIPLTEVRISKFADTETHVQIEESLRGKDLYII